jgi:hypothetical protein
LRTTGGKLYIREKEVTFEELYARISGQYLLQKRITQHPQLSKLHAESVNTSRVITFNNHGNIEVFSAALRIGTKGRSIDNWSDGGILVGVDLQKGRLQNEGFFKPGYGGKIEEHPDSGITLKDFAIPFFSGSIELACKLHSYIVRNAFCGLRHCDKS